MSATIESLEQELSDVRDSELISRCLKLCHAYGLSASELSTQWDLLQLNSKVGRMSVENLARLEDKLRDTAPTPAAKRQKGLLEPRTATETRTPGAPRSTPMGKIYSDDSVHLLQIGGVLGKKLHSLTLTIDESAGFCLSETFPAYSNTQERLFCDARQGRRRHSAGSVRIAHTLARRLRPPLASRRTAPSRQGRTLARCRLLARELR
eukprot:6182019-Pleurochrysis_carterae.AAC.1